MLRGMLRRALAIFIVATMIVSSHSFYVLAQGLNETEASETVENEKEQEALEESAEKAEAEDTEAETEAKVEGSETEVKKESSNEELVGEEADEEETEETEAVEEPEDPADIEETESEVEVETEAETEAEVEVETEAETESAKEEISEDEKETSEEVIAEPETDAETSIEETTEETEAEGEGSDVARSAAEEQDDIINLEDLEVKEETEAEIETGIETEAEVETETGNDAETETSAEMIPEEVAETVEAKKAGLYWALQYTYDNFLDGTKTVKFAYNPILWELEGIDTNDPNSMWILDPNATQHATQITLLCNYEKFADGTYNIDEFDFPNFVSTGYGSGVDELVFKMEYVPIDPNATYNFFDDYEMTDDKISNFGSDPHENFKNYYLDDYMGGTLFFSAPSQTANNITLVIGNGLTSMNSEAAYYIPLYLDAEARNERFNRIVEDLKSRFGEDVYIRGLGKGTGRTGTTFSTSTVVQNATQVTNLLTDENYETLILNETSNKKYFLVFGYYSVDSQKTWRLVIDDRFGHFTNETGLDEDGYFTYTIYNDPSDVVLPEMELINGVFYDNEFTGVGFTDSVNGTIDQLYAKFLMWLKSKGSTFVSQTYTADFVQTNFWFNFDNALHLSRTGPNHYWLKEMFDIVPPTIQKYNGSHYIFDKWTDVDGNELDLDEFVAAYQANPAQNATIYAREKAIEEKIIFDMSGFTSDMGTYEGDTEFYADATNWAPPTINCNSDYTFVGWSKEQYATALVSLDEMTAEITEWKENLEGNKTYYPVFIGKPMLHYTVDTSKGTVYDMPHGKMSFKYDEYTSDELFAARPEINGNFGYNFIGWNINSQYVELDDVANIIDTWAFDPSEDLVLEAAFESVGTLTLNIDTTKIEIADDPTGIQAANQIKLDGKTYAWPGITFNTIDDDIIFLGFGIGDELIIPIDEIADYYPGIMSHREDLVYDTIYRNKSRFIFNTTGIDGKGSISGTLSFKEDEASSITAPTVTDNNDYEFLGWTKNTSTNELISIDDAILDWNTSSDYNLYPVFKTLYNVIYTVRSSDSNKATVDFTGLTYEFKMPKQPLTNTSAVENIINSKPDSGVTRNKGFKFTGWSLNDEVLNASALANAINTATSDINIYAEFESLRLFTVNIDTGNFHIAGDSLTTQLIYDSEDTFASGISFTNTINSGKKLLGFGTGATATVAVDGLEDAFDAWKTTLPMADVVYNGILRNIYKINVINDINYSTEPDRTYRENNNASSEVISITPFIAKQGYMNSGFALTEGGTALTSDELDDMLNPWMYDSDITLYALYEEDPSVMRARFHIDISKLDTTLTDGNVELFTVSDFEALINELKDAQPIGNNIVSWMQDGVKLTSLEDAVWDGTSTTVIEPVFTVKPSPAPARGTSGGGGGSSNGSGSSDSSSKPEISFNSLNVKPGEINYSVPLNVSPILVSYEVDATGKVTSKVNNTVTDQDEWNTLNGADWSLINKTTNMPFTNGWAYIDYNGEHGWYRFDEKGFMVTGWYTENGNTYILAPSGNPWNVTHGKMLVGTYMIDGKLHTFDSSGKLVDIK